MEWNQMIDSRALRVYGRELHTAADHYCAHFGSVQDGSSRITAAIFINISGFSSLKISSKDLRKKIHSIL